MVDSVIAGTGNSRYLRTSLSASTTWEDALTMLRAGTFPIDLAGINQAGFTTLGTALNSATLLKSAVITALGLSADATPSDAWEAVIALIDDKADEDSVVTAVTYNSNTKELTATINGTATVVATFDFVNATEAANAAPVQSVAGKTGNVTLDGGNISYDDSATYPSGSVGAEVADLKSASGGITPVAQALLINILRNGVYKTDQSTNITNLETELAQGGGGSRVAIVNNLTNCTNSNSAISVDIGASYIGTITANEGYEMDSITVLMNGVDVTSSVVAGDVITIASVTGTVSITAVAISTAESGLVHYWNLKTGSLVDTIDGETELTLGGSASIASGTGVTVSAATDGIMLPFAQTGDEIITKAKIKFGAINRTASGNERLIGIKKLTDSTPSIALRYSNSDNVWETGRDISTGITSPTAFADNELILLRNVSKISIQFNGETIVNEYSSGTAYNYIQIGGGSSGSGFYTFVVESIKTFVEVSE